MASVVKSPTSPSRATQNMTTFNSGAGVASTKPLDIADDDDLDPAAFLQSVRELSAKREREDNERFRKLEEEIEKDRQERRARRAEYARSISPEKRDSLPQSPLRSSRAPSSRPSSIVAPSHFSISTTSISTPKSTTTSTTTSTDTPTKSSPAGVEEVPDFAGFGSVKKASAPTTPTSSKAMSSNSPALAPKPSPSAAMPGRSGTLRWQQRPTSRIGGATPVSMAVAEDIRAEKVVDQSREVRPSDREEQNKEAELSREEIAKSLSARDPSWFRQTQDRGIGNGAFRKSADEVGAGADMTRTSRMGLPGMAKETSSAASVRSSSSSTRAATQPTNVTTASTLLDNQPTPSLGRSPSPTKEMGGFVQSAMMKRNNSITKRSTVSQLSSLDRTASLRSGFGGLQGSHSMPKLEQPSEQASTATDSMARPASSTNLIDGAGRGHSRAKSITSGYTVNDHDRVASTPSSPSKRWSPNKSSWIESALTAKADSRPASPTKNSQPSWMSNLAKANAAKASTDSPDAAAAVATTPERSSTPTTNFAGNLVKEPVTVVDSLPRSPAFTKPDVTATSLTQEPLKTKPAIAVKPQLSPKPQIDFRSNLKPRAATEPTPQEQPEFLSRFGTLRKTATEKYVAPDTLKNNILRGKAGLSVTDGPQKRERRDELKESLVAKKEQWRQHRQDDIVQDRKTTVPSTPAKPEALLKRETMARTGAVSVPKSEMDMPTTPEALRRHHTIRSNPVATIPVADTNMETNVTTESVSKPLSFNSQLSGLLARRPAPSPTSTRQLTTLTTEELAYPQSLAAKTSRGTEDPLQDMRKGRAKGPKRRKAGMTMTTTADDENDVKAVLPTENVATIVDTPRSIASRSAAFARSPTLSKPTLSPKPATSPKPTTMLKEPLGWDEGKSQGGMVPEFKGFSNPALADILPSMDEDKENKTHVSLTMSPPIPSPSLKDEEAAMRSAKLLASAPRSPAPNQSGISGPPKPAKSSRSVSGQLQEASLNKVFPRFPSFRRDSNSRGTRIDARAVFTRRPTTPFDGRTIRKALYRLHENGSVSIVSPRDEYTLSEDGIYLFLHIRARGVGMATDLYTWIGRQASHQDIYDLKSAQRAIASEHKSAALHIIRQGHETGAFLAAIGGILITRASAARTTDPYMLCGRKHLGQIVFDEVECKPVSLCSAFAYVIWSPVTISEDITYIWRGSYCSFEELSAARLAAMELSGSGNVVELADGDEGSEFWKAFSDWPMREDDVLTCPEALKCKLEAGDQYDLRLFKIEKQESKPNFFTSMLLRRPSWATRSPAPVDNEVKYDAKELSPFTQADLDAEGIYVLDCYARIDVLIGPLSSAASSEDGLHQHTMRFVEDYVELCVEAGRPKPQCYVVQGGVPMHIPYVFRQWRNEHGLWGTAGLMAGLLQDKSVAQCMILQDALSTLQEKTLLQDVTAGETSKD